MSAKSIMKELGDLLFSVLIRDDGGGGGGGIFFLILRECACIEDKSFLIVFF